MGDFKRLRIWQKARAITLQMYSVTEAFPPSERFGCVSQIRRASASIAANIAESRGRPTPRDRARFLHIALGSARELESHLLLARDLGFLEEPRAREQLARVEELQRMLSAFIYKKGGNGRHEA